jgi:GT2 family glycosyltransferase
MKTIAVLLTVHNRREKTLKCLEQLYAQQLPHGYAIDVFLTDDGCTDGTPDAIREQYPDVHIVEGNGALYWNRGMHKAWQAASTYKDYDYYLWLNDDTVLNSDAIKILLVSSLSKNDKAIIVGTTSATLSEKTTYGGRERNGQLVIPTNYIQECDFFNGNIVLIPNYVFKIIGMNDPIFHHALGDFDYGLRAVKSGIPLYVSENILGKCDVHENLATWCNPQKPFSKRWKAFRTPLGQNPEQFFII